VSPCVLPLVPGYLSAVSGVSVTDMRQGSHKLSHVLWPAVVFCLSFTLMFVALGMTATGLGSTLRNSKETLDKVAGILIIAMGVFFLLTPFVPRLNREWRPDALIRRAGAGGPIIAGLAFAVAWTPCVGPTLASILAAASTSDTVAHGGILLAFYSLGLAVPFLATALAFDRATTAFRWIRDRYLVVTAVSGCVLIAMGVLILTGELTELNVQAQRALSDLGLDFLYNI
jgi:cytochrome c-type biogenesis protein